jgi:hypothetical protein
MKAVARVQPAQGRRTATPWGRGAPGAAVVGIFHDAAVRTAVGRRFCDAETARWAA